MAAAPDLAPIGALIGEPSRAAILSELMDGRALTATELATRAGVSPATASVHLAKLVSGGLLAVEPSGRHRYFRLARPRVARALETLAGLTPRVPAASSGGPPTDDIRFARTCYDHLAGWLGVGIRNALVEKGFLLPAGSEFRLTRKGDAWMAAFGVDVAAVRSGRRSFARACLDWSERRHHVAGALGRAFLGRLLGRRWLVRRPGERALELTALGRRELARELGIRVVQGGPGTG